MVAVYNREYYENNKTRFISRAQEWVKNNPERRKEIAVKWSRENRDKRKQYQDNYRKENCIKYLYALAKRRAKRRNLDFNIEISDLALPKECPLLGIPINSYSVINDYRPSIDRINSNLGYIKGNVWVISWRANRFKNSASFDELLSMVVNLDKRLNN